MSVGTIVLVAGLLVVPAVLLRLGHRLRDRGPAEKGAFWGGLAGYGLGLGVFLVLALVPPVAWSMSPLRSIAAEWVLLTLPAIGAGIGLMRGRRALRSG